MHTPRFVCILLAIAALVSFWARPARAEILADLASPVTTPAYIPLAVGAGITLALLAFEDQIIDPLQKDISDDRPLGKFSKVGDYGGRLIQNGAYVAGMVLAGALGNENGYKNAEVMFLASAYSVTVSSLLKITVREPRPNDGNDRQSFPSGHATAAFSFASVIGAQHGWRWGVPAYALATLTAVSRMNDNKHYIHDVVAGATIGITYGLGVHYLHSKKETAVSFAPLFGEGRRGLAFNYTF